MKRRDPLQGRRSPDFVLCDQRGKRVAVRSFRGRPLVLCFFPNAFSPGCSLMTEDFAGKFRKMKAAGAAVLGVSCETVEAHARFARARKVPFQLLSDRARRVCRKYRVIKRKVLYGKPFVGVERTTFVIDARGIIRRVFRDVEPKGHLDEVLAALKEV